MRYVVSHLKPVMSVTLCTGELYAKVEREMTLMVFLFLVNSTPSVNFPRSNKSTQNQTSSLAYNRHSAPCQGS